MRSSDVVVLVVDATVGATATDEAMARVLRRSPVPVILVANKVDDERGHADAAALWSLGLGEPLPISALHGRGSGDLLDAILAAMPDAPRETFGAAGRSAPGGAAGQAQRRQVVAAEQAHRGVPFGGASRGRDHHRPGRLAGRTGRRALAVRRHRRAAAPSADRLRAWSTTPSLRTRAALDAAEVAIVLIDASVPMTEQDQRVVTMVIESGRALVIAMNKADLVDADRRAESDRELDRDLARVPWAARINISATTGRGVHRLAPALRTALDSWDRRDPDRPAEPVAGRTDRRRHRRRCAAASSRGCCSPPRPPTGRRPSCCSPPDSWRPATGGSSNAGCGRTSTSPGSPVRINVRVREKRDRHKK